MNYFTITNNFIIYKFRAISKYLCDNPILIIILVFSFLLRSYHMDMRDLTIDEVFSLFYVTDKTFFEIMNPYSLDIKIDAHPPFYYLFVKFWMATGYQLLHFFTSNRDYSFRFPFALLGTLTTFITYKIGEKVSNKNLGLIFSSLYCLNSFSIQIAHQTRMYPIIELFSALILYNWLFLKTEFSRNRAISLIIFTSLIWLTYYASIFFIAIVWLTLILLNRKDQKKFFLCAFFCILCCLWWLPGLLGQLNRESLESRHLFSTGVIIPFTVFHFITGERDLLLGISSELNNHIIAIASFLMIISLLVYKIYKNLLRFEIN